jgi:valyl-tRNA synthetase
VIAPFPKVSRKAHDAAAESEMSAVVGIVGAIRAIRSESRISPAATVTVVLKPAPDDAPRVTAQVPLIAGLARATVTVDPGATRPPNSAVAVASGTEVYVPLEGMVDLAAERARLTREIERADKDIGMLRSKLARPDFVEKAPAEVVAKERGRLSEQETIREKLAASLLALG